MRCNCGFSEAFNDSAYAPVRTGGHLTCPYCQGDIVCVVSKPSLCHSAAAYALLAPMVKRRKVESFWVFCVDARNRLIGHEEVARGTANYLHVPPRDVFHLAIVKHATGVILVHNHPSGDPTPSLEDESITERLAEVGRLLGVGVLDHLIITSNPMSGYYSFRDSGALGA